MDAERARDGTARSLAIFPLPVPRGALSRLAAAERQALHIRAPLARSSSPAPPSRRSLTTCSRAGAMPDPLRSTTPFGRAHAMDTFAFEEATVLSNARLRRFPSGRSRARSGVPVLIAQAKHAFVAGRERRELCARARDPARARRCRGSLRARASPTAACSSRAESIRFWSACSKRHSRVFQMATLRSVRVSWRGWPRRDSPPRRKCANVTSISGSMPSRWPDGSPIGASPAVLHSAPAVCYGAADQPYAFRSLRDRSDSPRTRRQPLAFSMHEYSLAIDYSSSGISSLTKRSPRRMKPLARSLTSRRTVACPAHGARCSPCETTRSTSSCSMAERVASNRSSVRDRVVEAFTGLLLRAAERHAGSGRASGARNLWLAMLTAGLASRASSPCARTGADAECAARLRCRKQWWERKINCLSLQRRLATGDRAGGTALSIRTDGTRPRGA